MEEIRAFACDELLQLSHGGDEVAGVLFGTRRDDLIRILTWRPIACEHTRGEGVHLSYTDRMNLAVQLEVARQTPDLKDLRPVGWFVSHSQGSVALWPSDLEIYNAFFPEASQVTLVIRPAGSGRAQAGFFAREAEGKLQSDSSYQCFDVEPLRLGANPTLEPAQPAPTVEIKQPVPAAEAAGQHAPPPTPHAPAEADAPVVADAPTETQSPRKATERESPEPAPVPASPVAPPLVDSRVLPASGFESPSLPSRSFLSPGLESRSLESPSFEVDERVPTHERWLWAIPILLALGIAAFLLYQRRVPSPNTALGLRALAEAQTVQLAWDGNSRVVRDSDRGEMEIKDGGKSSQVSLTSDQLQAGKMSYLPQSSDVSFAMTVYPANGEPIHDSTRLIAPAFSAPRQPPQLLPASPPPASPPPASPLPISASAASNSQAGALAQQVQQLKEDLSKERAHTDELQNLVRILENRLGIQRATPDTRRRP
jgi:hypothetical protein